MSLVVLLFLTGIFTLVWPSRYVVSLYDRLGIVLVMNHAASYTLVAVSLVDRLARRWLTTDQGAGRILALWIAGWWSVRAVVQVTFGRRLGVSAILAYFGLLATLHLVVALR